MDFELGPLGLDRDGEEDEKIQEISFQPSSCSTGNGNGNIPRLFFNLYFGCGTILYNILTIWLFFACCFGSEDFTTSGFFYMLAITGLMWLSTILTLIASEFSKELGMRDVKLRPTILFFFVLLVKLLTDAAIFYGSIEALVDPHLVHYHEFSQFVGPLIYFGLLYLVTLIEMIVILTTIAVMEDRCGIYAGILKIQETKANFERFIRSKFPVSTDV